MHKEIVKYVNNILKKTSLHFEKKILETTIKCQSTSILTNKK